MRAVGLGLVLMSSLATAAEPTPTGVQSLPFAADERCSQPEQREALLSALRLRLPELEIERVDAAAAGPDALVWAADAAERCVLTLATVDGLASLPLDTTSADALVRAAAVRVAWWLELRARRAAVGDGVPDPSPPVTVDPPEVPTPRKRPSHSVFIGVQFGATWYPTLGQPAGTLRLSAFVPLGAGLQLGLEGALGTQVTTGGALDVDVYDRRLGLLVRYEVPISAAVELGVTLGLRYALPEFDADEVTEVRVARPESNLSVTSGIGASWRVADALRLRADVLAGVSVGSRGLTSSGGKAGDLGVVTVDALLGFELSL